MFQKKRILTDNAFDNVGVYIPKSISNIIKAKSEESGVAVSRLIVHLIDKALDSDTAFDYPVVLPTDEYIEYSHAKEAGIILDFIRKMPNGIAKDTVVLCRRELGISDRETVLYALRELFEKDLIEEFRPRMRGYMPKDYRRLRFKELYEPEVKRRLKIPDEMR